MIGVRGSRDMVGGIKVASDYRRWREMERFSEGGVRW